MKWITRAAALAAALLVLVDGSARPARAFGIIEPAVPVLLVPTVSQPGQPTQPAGAGAPPAGPHPLAPPGFSIGINITGVTNANDSLTPPDSNGAAGPNQYVELINGAFAVFNKSDGSLAAPVVTQTQFWQNAGVTPANIPFDPRIVFDPASQRWFASAVDNPFAANHFLVAVSSSANPLGGWTGFSVASSNDSNHWADFPTLGVSRDTVTLAANMANLNNNSNIDQVGLLVLPKADLISGSIASKVTFYNQDPNATGFTIQPAVDMNNTSATHVLLSDYNTPAGVIKRSDITPPPPSYQLDTSKPLIPITPFNQPPPAAQQGSTGTIDTIDTRFGASVILQNGNIWGVQTVNNNGLAALHWVRIDAATNTLKEQGLISSPTIAYFDGSIAVDSNGNIVIGFSGSGSSQFVSDYAVAGLFDGTSTSFGAPGLLKAGEAAYGAAGQLNRWGDYSATTIDPTNPGHFWTIQEFPQIQGGGVGWATQITEIIVAAPSVPEPSTLVLTAMGGGFALAGALVARRRRPAAAQPQSPERSGSAG